MAEDSLYPRIFILELIQRTKRCAIVWERTDSTVLYSQWVVGSRTYDAYLNYMGSTYRIDIRVNTVQAFATNNSIVDEVQELYLIVDSLLSQNPFIRPLKALQKQVECNSIANETFDGGILIAGDSIVSRLFGNSVSGGVKVSGQASILQFLASTGGVVVGGTAPNDYLSLRIGGVRVGGSAIVETPEGIHEATMRIISDYDTQLSNVDLNMYNLFGGGTFYPVPPEPMFIGLGNGSKDLYVKPTALPINTCTLTLKYELDPVIGLTTVNFITLATRDSSNIDFDIRLGHYDYYDLSWRIENTSGTILTNYLNYATNRNTVTFVHNDGTNWASPVLVLKFVFHDAAYNQSLAVGIHWPVINMVYNF